MVGFGCPGVDLNTLSERDHEELDALELDDLKVDGAVQVAHVDPAVPSLHLLRGNGTRPGVSAYGTSATRRQM